MEAVGRGGEEKGKGKGVSTADAYTTRSLSRSIEYKKAVLLQR